MTMPLPIYAAGATGGNYGYTPMSFDVPKMYNAPSPLVGWQADLFREMAKSFQGAQNEARGTNEQRFGDILGGLRDRYSNAMGYLDNMGAAGLASLRNTFQGQQTAALQNLANVGLTNSTLQSSLRSGFARDQALAEAQYNEQLRRERMGYDTGLSKDVLDFMERRQDTYPDMNQLGQLAMGLGRAGGGYGGSMPYSASTFVTPPRDTGFHFGMGDDWYNSRVNSGGFMG